MTGAGMKKFEGARMQKNYKVMGASLAGALASLLANL